jgi:hypothetical protein
MKQGSRGVIKFGFSTIHKRKCVGRGRNWHQWKR